VVTLLALGVGLRTPATATMRYGPLQVSGNLETQNLVRDSSIDSAQFIENRNTIRLRVDYDWLQNGRFIDKYDFPFIESSKLYLLYRGVYDGFYDIAPTDLQHGQTRFDDIVGGPIAGNNAGQLGANGKLLPGNYSRLTGAQRTGLKFDDTLREAYVDLKVANAPVSFRLGRQQVIWGESDQFRLMDIWNPLDLTWHLQQESWDNIRIPLWLGKGLWDIGEVGPLSNSFLEVVYNPFDFQPDQKLDFLPQPWSVPYADPLRGGQVTQGANPSILYTPIFNLHGTSFRRGDFGRNPQDASEVGARFHAVTPQGVEFTANYLYARGRGIGANTPGFGVKIDKISIMGSDPSHLQDLNGAPFPGAAGIKDLNVDAKVVYPYNHIFGLTGNYFEGDYTSAVLRFETAYALGEAEQTVEPSKTFIGGPFRNAPLGFDKRDVWAGMVGFDRPTWIRILNPKATWFLTGQFFWSYTGNVDYLRGSSGASETPYFTPPGWGHSTQGLVQWATGPNAGLVERLQAGTCNNLNTPGVPCVPGTTTADGSGNLIHHWEHLITFAGTSFYRGGTVVPFVADAWDPVNDNDEVLWNIDYFYSNNFIITLQQKFFFTYGSKLPSDDPWGAGGLNTRRDETGVKLTYQF